VRILIGFGTNSCPSSVSNATEALSFSQTINNSSETINFVVFIGSHFVQFKILRLCIVDGVTHRIIPFVLKHLQTLLQISLGVRFFGNDP